MRRFFPGETVETPGLVGKPLASYLQTPRAPSTRRCPCCWSCGSECRTRFQSRRSSARCRRPPAADCEGENEALTLLVKTSSLSDTSVIVQTVQERRRGSKELGFDGGEGFGHRKVEELGWDSCTYSCNVGGLSLCLRLRLTGLYY